jgi:hypothetical protein
MKWRSCHRNRRIGRVAVAALVFVLSFALAIWALPQLELRPGGYPTLFKIRNDNDPGADSFFVSRGHHELSHLALYHDIGSSIDNARNADILIIGNSRAQLGFSEKVFVGEAEKLGLSVFNLAVGHADSARFARDLLRRFDLRPRILIANGGPFFYGNNYSPWAQEVVAMSRWEAYKTFFEYSLVWQAESRLHRYLPYLSYFKKFRYRWTHYRSPRTGWWRNTRIPPSRYPIRPDVEAKSYARSLPVAQELKTELDSRSSLLILTIMPYRKVQTGHLPYLSRELGVPYILPPFDGIQTADSSHLAPDSADRISEYIWRALIDLPAVQERLSLPGKN